METMYKLTKLGLTFSTGRPQPLGNAKSVTSDKHFQSTLNKF